MRFLHLTTLELIIYLTFKGYFYEEYPYEFYTKVFYPETDNIERDLRINKIYNCINLDIGEILQTEEDGTETLSIDLYPTSRIDIEIFIEKYIKEFKENKLIPIENVLLSIGKYYSFDEHIQLFSKLILEPNKKEDRKSFTINYNFNEVDFSLAKEVLQKDFELKKFRLYELLLYLNDKKYIKINKDFDFVELKNPSNLADENKTHVLSINITLKNEWYKILKLLPNTSKPQEKQLKFINKPEDVRNSKNVDIYLDEKPISLSYPEYEFLFNIVVKEKEFYSSDVDNQRIKFEINEKVKDALEDPFWCLLKEIPVLWEEGQKRYALSEYVKYRRRKSLSD